MSEQILGTVKLTLEPPLAWLTLSRPHKLNALDRETLEGIAAAAAAVDEQPEIAVAILSGEGSDFSAGADLRSLADVPADKWLRAIREGAEAGRVATAALRQMRPITIALAHGRVIGGGMVLVAACDLRVVTEDAVFWLPEVDLGIPVGWGGVPVLVAELGPSLARDLVLTCRRIGAVELREAGFVSRLVAPAEAARAARELADQIAAKPAGALTRSKQQFLDALDASVSGSASGRSDADLIVAALAESSRTGLAG
ncbi:MAG TPA: enoyl-CoA hydratase/isomerase family protein [Solirubrobacteraceae bacterium]|jgi:enoyl-CoA hydratase/carnithine racemase